MPSTPIEDASYQAALRTVQRKLRFFSHLMVYVVTICLLIAINLLTTPNYFWAIWPMLGWGIGVAMHWMQAYFCGQMGALQRRMLENELREISKKPTERREY